MTFRGFPLDRISLAVLVFTVAGATGCGRDAGSSAPHDARVEAALQEVLDRAVVRPDVFLPGAVTYYQAAGWAPWAGSAGVADLQAQAPMRHDARIRAGSIVKTFVAVVTLQLVEQGVLSLDATLPELLPASVTDLVPSAGLVTLRMLLNHTSGIPEWTTDEVHAFIASHPEYVWTDDEILAIALAQPSLEPGAGWSYSNTNYTLVGMILDRAGGESWRAQVRARVIAPLGLAATSLPEPGDRTITADDAHGYEYVAGAPVELTFVDPSMAGAGGGNAMISSVHDLARFVEELLAGRLFARPETLAEMITMVPAENGTPFPHWYGLGVEAYELDGTTVVGNAGGAAGYATMMYRIPARDATLVTSINASDMFANALNVLIPSLQVVTAPAP